MDNHKYFFSLPNKLLNFCLAAVFIVLCNYSGKAQFVAGEYGSATFQTGSIYLSGSNFFDCHDYELSVTQYGQSYVTGLNYHFFVDSIQGNIDSLRVRNSAIDTFIHMGDSLPLFSGGFYIYANSTNHLFYSIKGYGTPMISGETYACEFVNSIGAWEDGCSTLFHNIHASGDDCTVLDGTFNLLNDSCYSPIELGPGLNYVNNNNATSEQDIEISCFDDVESNTAENGVWYSFTTPEYYKRIRLRSSSTQCDTVELVGTQMAVFTSCDSEPIACSSPGDSLFADITFECGELELNTTYYVLLDGWAGETGICRLFYNIYNSCPPGCMDSTACNYNENAFTDDGSCLYGDACIPTHELTVDTIDCHNFIVHSDLTWSPFFEPWFNWSINGYPLYESIMPYSLNLSDLPEGYHDICLYVYHNIGMSETCIQIYVPENCEEPCTTQITATELGCSMIFSLEPEAPEDSLFLWDLGNGETIEGGGNIVATYAEQGEYTTCLDLTNYFGCVDTVLCIDFDLTDCVIDSSIYGCTDTTACNYNPDVIFEDGSCQFDFDCNPIVILGVDTIDCESFTFTASVDQEMPETYFWLLDGQIEEIGYLDTIFHVDSLSPGIHEICFQIFQISGFEPSCVEIYVPENCEEPCTTQITMSELGCGMMFSLEPEAPEGSVFNWNLGNGETIEGGGNILISYAEPGQYTTCIDLTNYFGCVDTTLCANFDLTDCVVDSSLYGCLDTSACNYNPYAIFDDGSCFYEAECTPSIFLSTDSLDCHTYLFNAYLNFETTDPFLWLLDGYVVGVDISEGSYLAEELSAGMHTICCQFPTQDGPVPNCIEFYVPESCWQECTTEITSLQLGCGMAFSLNEVAPDSVLFLWDFGNGETMETGDETFALYTEDGYFNTCIYLNDYQGCIDTTICTGFFMEGCEPDSLVYGCIDPLAINFNPLANVSDSSCVYLSDCAFDLEVSPDTTLENLYVISTTFIDSTVIDIEWSFGDGTFSSELYVNYNYGESGSYELCCTATFMIDSLTCFATNCTTIVIPDGGGSITFSQQSGVVNNVSERRNDIDLNLWPNPANDVLYWSHSKNHTSAIMHVYSATGQELLKTDINGINKGNIRLASFESGVYYLVLTGDYGTSQSRFVVTK